MCVNYLFMDHMQVKLNKHKLHTMTVSALFVCVHGEDDRNHSTVVPPQKDGKHPAAQLSRLSDPAQLRPDVLASLHAAVQAFRQDSSQHEVHMHLSTSC